MLIEKRDDYYLNERVDRFEQVRMVICVGMERRCGAQRFTLGRGQRKDGQGGQRAGGAQTEQEDLLPTKALLASSSQLLSHIVNVHLQTHPSTCSIFTRTYTRLAYLL